MKKAYIFRLAVSGIVIILTILAICGFYSVKLTDMQFTAVLQKLLIDFSWSAAIILAGIIILTFLFGRFYCSVICPFGILQEFSALLFKKKNTVRKNLPVKYFIAALTFGALIGGSALFIRYVDPYTMFGPAVSLTIVGMIFTFAVLALVFFKNRYFCTNICPVGAVLGLISKVSLNKIYIDKENCVSCGLCAKHCPSGCIDFKEKYVDNEMCIKCLKCLGECKRNALKYGIIPKKDVKFSIKRRELLISASLLIILGGAIKAGIETGKRYSKKIRNIILPPGAENASRMANKCLNCNLCIKNCPGKILAKSDKDFPAVHIDYSLGEGYCKFDCSKCSEVCPSGAIKRLSLNEKQNTRIAMAMIKDEKCTKCGICAYECPTGAISKIDDKMIIDGTKCIGCGKCKKSCNFGSIEIFGVNEQRRI